MKGFFYTLLKYSNDAKAVRKNKVGRRIGRRVFGKVTGKISRSLFR